MAFTTLSLNIQSLQETTFISDMRLIINANNTVLQNQIQNIVNTLEIDLVNKYIGVDNYLGQVKTNNVILGNGIQFMDSTTMIAQLSKSAGKSTFSLDYIVIQPGGSIDCSGAANTIVSKRLGVGIALADVTSDGLFVGKSSLSVPSSFYGPVTFAKQAVTHSTEGSTNTNITTNTVTLTGPTTGYYGELKLTATSKQFIYLSIKAPVGATPTSANPIYVLLYEDPTSQPVPGQTYTIVIKEFLDSVGTPITLSNWGAIYLIPGYDVATLSTKVPGIINGGSAPVSGSVASWINGLDTFGSEKQHVKFYNANIETVVSPALKKFGASVHLTKFENITNGARFVITSSHNITVIN